MDPFVDWGIAERVALGIAGTGDDPGPFSPTAVDRACVEATALVLDYTRLAPPRPLPQPEVVDRAEWVGIGLETLRELSRSFEERIASGMNGAGPLSGLARTVGGAAAGAEAGVAVGYAARKVLGQYEVAFTDRDREPRLLFVGPNLAGAHAELGERPDLFLKWIAIHETTHAVQFTAVPWLRPHLIELLEELVQGASEQLDRESLQAFAKRILSTDPRRTIRSLFRGDLARLLAGPEQARTLDRLQAVMSVIEGHAEHVMDAAGAAGDPGYRRLRERLEARRSRRGGLGEVISKLLGLELKLRQYQVGKRFCDAVVAEVGVDGLNAVWSGPEALPTLAELERPSRWLERTAAPAAA